MKSFFYINKQPTLIRKRQQYHTSAIAYYIFHRIAYQIGAPIPPLVFQSFVTQLVQQYKTNYPKTLANYPEIKQTNSCIFILPKRLAYEGKYSKRSSNTHTPVHTTICVYCSILGPGPLHFNL